MSDSVGIIESFKKEKLKEAMDWANMADGLRQKFLKRYPKSQIGSLSLYDYMIAPKGYGQENSFCYMLRRDLQAICSMGNAFDDCFGIYLKNGTTITLNKTLSKKFGSDVKTAFEYEKAEIIALLNAVDNDDYEAIENNGLNSIFKHKLLAVYYRDKFIPVCTKSILDEYCERMGLSLPQNMGMIYKNLELVALRDSIPVIQEWNNSVIMSLCVWLIKNRLKIDGQTLVINYSTSKVRKIEKEIDSLDLKGETREAVVKVRVNQGVFRDLLLCKFKKCCLCGVNSPDLLIASHIKPWAQSDADEKLDINNGFLMCPNHDILFDKGYISFDDEGGILISNQLSNSDKTFTNVNENMKIHLTEKNKEYLKYHRDFLFKK